MKSLTIWNTKNTYGTISKFLHWLIAICVILLLCAGVSFSYLPDGSIFNVVMMLHKSLGITVLGLILLRLLWRLINITPTLPALTPRWEYGAIRFVQFFFYFLLIAMPITGVVMSVAKSYPLPFWGLTTFTLSFIPKDPSLGHLMAHWHYYLAWSIALFIVIHTLAALKHHWIDKDDVLKRMI